MKPTVLTALVLIFCVQTNATNIFVNQNSSGDGTSWASAFGSLTSALAMAKPGDQIWVAKGTYTPTASTDRNARFIIPSGVKVYGGFKGTETALDQRNIQSNTTILSGEINQPGMADNSFTIVYFDQANENTILDGFTLSAGNANGELSEGNPSRCGGAVYVNGERGVSKPTIANCIFANNFGRDGAAVYNNGRNGESSPVFLNCVFKNNEAGLDGGAMFNDGRLGGISNPVLENCLFERNMGTYGGAICNATETGACNLTLTNCSFTENAAYLRGGAVFSMNGNEKCFLEMSGCQFTNNFPDDQNMIFTSAAGRSDAFKIASGE